MLVVLLCVLAFSVSDAIPDKRIIQGTYARNGDVPWLGGFHFFLARNPPFFCGGALINDDTVVTAAHCFINSRRPQDYSFMLGEVSLHNVKLENVYKLSRISIHPRYMYRYPDKTYDLAVVKLARKATMGNSVKPISLPNKGFKSPMGTECLVAGWGRTEYAHSEQYLKKTNVRVTSIAACKKAYPDIYWTKPDTQICAGGDSESNVCKGDSGGPMACQMNGKWILEGAVSFGYNHCGLERIMYPAVFTRISSYVDWIKHYSQ